MSICLNHLLYRPQLIRERLPSLFQHVSTQQFLSRRHQLNLSPRIILEYRFHHHYRHASLPACSKNFCFFKCRKVLGSFAYDSSSKRTCTYVISAVERNFKYPSAFKSRSTNMVHIGTIELYSSDLGSLHKEDG